MMKVLVGITGASGAVYAYRLISQLQAAGNKVCAIFTEAARQVWDWELGSVDLNVKIYKNDDFMTPPASGSSDIDAMVVCPCSMGTLGKIANGVTDNLLVRAADVMLKERKKLILVVREMPYNLAHIDNMRKITLMGGVIVAASPSFYTRPETIEDLVDTVVEKVKKQLGLKSKIQWPL